MENSNFDQIEPISSGCKSCNKNKFTKEQGWMIVLGVFVLFTSVYGTIKMFQGLLSLIF